MQNVSILFGWKTYICYWAITCAFVLKISLVINQHKTVIFQGRKTLILRLLLWNSLLSLPFLFSLFCRLFTLLPPLALLYENYQPPQCGLLTSSLFPFLGIVLGDFNIIVDNSYPGIRRGPGPEMLMIGWDGISGSCQRMIDYHEA